MSKLAKAPNGTENTVTLLTIMEREFKIASPSRQVESLKRAAEQLDLRMREIRTSDKLLTLDRVAVLAALMLVVEANESSNRYESLSQSVQTELKRLNSQLANAGLNSTG